MAPIRSLTIREKTRLSAVFKNQLTLDTGLTSLLHQKDLNT